MHWLFARIRVKTNVTQLMSNRLLLKLEDVGMILLRVTYEKLSEFCFCCGLIWHQFRECLKYKGQPKDDLTYGTWMRAQSRAEKAEQTRDKDRENGGGRQSTTTIESQEQQERYQKNTGRAKPDGNRDKYGSTQANMKIYSEPIGNSQVKGVGVGALIKDKNRDRL